MAEASGVHLRRGEDRTPAIDELAEALGGRPGLPALLADLDRRGRRGWAPGLATARAFTWDAADRRTRRWWPQGITTSDDAAPDGLVRGRRLVLTTWYARAAGGNGGARLTVVDLATRRYAHVLLATTGTGSDGTPLLRPARVHAGGVAWVGDHVHVAATARGLLTFRLADLLRVPEPSGSAALSETLGHRWVLPARFHLEAVSPPDAEPLRYSCLSLDRHPDPPELVVAEYARGERTRRLARFRLDPDGLLHADGDGASRPLLVADDGVRQTQGAAWAAGSYHLTVSHGPWVPGSVYVGRPGAWVRRRWATPPGPEDLAYSPGRDELWSLTEHPRRRWVFVMPRTRLAGLNRRTAG